MKAIQLIKWFEPNNVDWKNSEVKNSCFRSFGVLNKRNWRNGLTPEQAFFLKTERGIIAGKITDCADFIRLLFCQNRMAMHEKMWREGNKDKTCLITDFINEPQYVKDFVYNRIFGYK